MKKYIIGIAVVVPILFVAMMGCRYDKIKITHESVTETTIEKRPQLNVYVENSGSMDGYMCAGSQLKDAVYDYVSELNRYTETTNLYYINSQTIPYNGNLDSYIKDLTPASFRKAGGNTSSTDLGSIIGNVLESVNDTTVCIFISDCILDLPSKDAKKYLTNCEIKIKNEIVNARKRLPDLGVEILKLFSDFNGKYFYPDGKIEMIKDVKRPYYMWVFGDKKNLSLLNADVDFSMLEKHGFADLAAFSNYGEVTFEIANASLTGNIINPVKDSYHATLRANFRTTLQPDKAITDISNYSFNNKSIVIDKVDKISAEGNYTHYINFTIPQGAQIAQECLRLNVPAMPAWVEETNDESGTNIEANISKTTGIKYLIQGVADAYNDQKKLTDFTFTINKHF